MLRIQRGYRWIALFFIALVPYAYWACFIDTRSPDLRGGTIGVALSLFFAVYGYLKALRPCVSVTHDRLEVTGIGRTRSVRWSEIGYASMERDALVFHPPSGEPLKVSVDLDGFNWLYSVVKQRGLLRNDPSPS
ncbi:MAG TPA: hypothetical protein VMU84_03400 [Thermoanaerobaculia bacterium]|nr:hypothetical protein [Thermoanaerobaculia bacterium]